MVDRIDTSLHQALAASDRKRLRDKDSETGRGENFAATLAASEVVHEAEPMTVNAGAGTVEDEEALLRAEKIRRLKAEVKAGTYLADSREIARTLALALERYI